MEDTQQNRIKYLYISLLALVGWNFFPPSSGSLPETRELNGSAQYFIYILYVHYRSKVLDQ